MHLNLCDLLNLCAVFVFAFLPPNLLAQTTQPIANRYSTLPIPDGGRIVIDAPDYIDGRKPIRLIIYALPNGNSVEWTAGATTQPGDDWHYNIQNIAAQLALLRLADPKHNDIVAYLESPKKSWPAWSADHPADAPQRARAIVASIEHLFALPGRTIELALICHSGGGSFVTRYLVASDPLPAELNRVAYLDGYYGYDDEPKLAETICRWLSADAGHAFFLCCYDDRNITIDGRKVISETGGGFRASHRLLAGMTRTPEPSSRQSIEEAITYLDFLQGRAHFVIHANPSNLILHTRLVEWNGLLRAVATADAALPQTWRVLRERRSYDAYQPAQPIRPPSTRSATTRQVETKDASLQLPARPTTAPGGHAFMTALAALPTDRQQAAIIQETCSGNLPEALRHWKTIHVEATDAAGQAHVAEFRALPDYLTIGSTDDFVRVPMLPSTAQRIADALHCSLPTRKMVDDIYECADIQLDPQPMTEQREAIQTFVAQNDLIEKQLSDWKSAAATQPASFPLIAGTKKDIVITPRLATNPHKVAIYGWHTRDSRPIQPLTTVHKDTYVDYSHGARLIDQTMIVDGQPMNIADVLADPKLCSLLSDEGPITEPRYPAQSFEPATRNVR